MATRRVFEEEALPQLGALRNFALQLCRDEQHSHDLVQETMLKAYTYFHTYREGTNCRAWLFQICKNSYINETKKRKHQPVGIDFQEEESGEFAEKTDEVGRNMRVPLSTYHSERLETEVLSDEVATAFETLPPDYQTVLILCDIECYTYEEIAAFMQAPVGTVRSRIHRGRRILAGQLAEYARLHRFISQPPLIRN